MRDAFLPFALPDIDESELAQIGEALASGWITTGPKTRQFEAEFAAIVGARHAIAVNSCTAAMHLALEAVGLQRGDEVITTPYTFAASAEVVRYFDARPVLVDVNAGSFNIDVDQIEAAITSRTKAIIPVHIAGQAADLDAIYAIAQRHKLAVIEDAAHAFPTTYRGRMIGAPPPLQLKHAACFSFYATKTIATGEGGIWHPERPEFLMTEMSQEDARYVTHLWLVNAETGARTDLSALHEFPVEDNQPSWSPDGAWIAFRRKELAGPRESLSKQLWLMRADGSDARPLTADPAIDHGPMAWSPDGRFVLFHKFPLRGEDITISVWMMDVAGGEQWQVAPGQRPLWLP